MARISVKLTVMGGSRILWDAAKAHFLSYSHILPPSPQPSKFAYSKIITRKNADISSNKVGSVSVRGEPIIAELEGVLNVEWL